MKKIALFAATAFLGVAHSASDVALRVAENVNDVIYATSKEFPDVLSISLVAEGANQSAVNVFNSKLTKNASRTTLKRIIAELVDVEFTDAEKKYALEFFESSAGKVFVDVYLKFAASNKQPNVSYSEEEKVAIGKFLTSTTGQKYDLLVSKAISKFVSESVGKSCDEAKNELSSTAWNSLSGACKGR